MGIHVYVCITAVDEKKVPPGQVVQKLPVPGE